jgi:hypothetical protein
MPNIRRNPQAAEAGDPVHDEVRLGYVDRRAGARAYRAGYEVWTPESQRYYEVGWLIAVELCAAGRALPVCTTPGYLPRALDRAWERIGAPVLEPLAPLAVDGEVLARALFDVRGRPRPVPEVVV